MMSKEDLDTMLPEIDEKLSTMGGSGAALEGSLSKMNKLANIQFKNKKHVKDKIKQELIRIKNERDRIEEKQKYWKEQLS
jgi:hypothetical protein